jgi:hypothetical protein
MRFDDDTEGVDDVDRPLVQGDPREWVADAGLARVDPQPMTQTSGEGIDLEADEAAHSYVGADVPDAVGGLAVIVISETFESA